MHIIRSGGSTIPSIDIGYLSNNNITIMLSTARALSIDFSAYLGITGRLAPCLFLKFPKQRCSDSRPDQIWCLFLRYPTASGECFDAEARQRCSHSRPGQLSRAGTAFSMYVPRPASATETATASRYRGC